MLSRLFSTTYECDKAHGTNYHENFVKFMKYAAEADLTVDGAMTDPKGDRSLAPHAQAILICSCVLWSAAPTVS